MKETRSIGTQCEQIWLRSSSPVKDNTALNYSLGNLDELSIIDSDLEISQNDTEYKPLGVNSSVVSQNERDIDILNSRTEGFKIRLLKSLCSVIQFIPSIFCVRIPHSLQHRHSSKVKSKPITQFLHLHQCKFSNRLDSASSSEELESMSALSS